MAEDKTKREQLEDRATKLEADRAAAEVEVQQEVGREQLRTGLDASHEKIRQDKDLPTPDPDLLPPEDGGNQTDPKKVETNEAAFNKADLKDTHAIKEAREEVKES